ncbi:MAG: hypothetical protein ACQEST_12700 [Bacteroidota bacterium]
MTVKSQSNQKAKLSQTTITFFSTVVIVMMLVLSGCGDDDPTSPELKNVVDVIISPDSAEFSVGEQMQFSAFVVTDEGDTIAAEDLDVEWEGEWWSSDPDVFTVEDNGLATGQNSGEAFCIVELDLEDDQTVGTAGFSIANTRGIFVGRDSAFVLMLN